MVYISIVVAHSTGPRICSIKKVCRRRPPATGVANFIESPIYATLKSQLGLCPNPHHKEDRIDGHVFISVLAYQLLRFITFGLELKGDYRNWESIRRVLQTHCYTTINLPTKSGAVHRIRKAGDPEECQKSIYKLLGVIGRNLPVIRQVLQQKNRSIL
jgi:hypothetical protein